MDIILINQRTCHITFKLETGEGSSKRGKHDSIILGHFVLAFVGAA